MANWVFIATLKKIEGDQFAAESIVEQRLNDGFWGLGEKTPNRRALKKGDSVVFYVGLPSMAFVANASLASDSFSLSEGQREKYGHGKLFYQAEYGVLLDQIARWQEPKYVKDLVPNLGFIENKESWFAYFQGGVRQLSDEDFRVIVEGRRPSLTEAIRATPDLISESEFALEAHLEDFIDQNWDRIDFGRRLERYEIEGQGSRQFPAGTWSIDFLCTEKDSGDLVVIELKRGKTSDATVGQLLRYMGWVADNIAKPKQAVKGIIIASEIDEGLVYATQTLPQITVLTYKVDFRLAPPKPARK